MTNLLRFASLCALLFTPIAVEAAPPGSRQAVYDTAQAAFDRDDWNGAIAGFTSLLPKEHGRPLQTSEAVIATRLANALFQVGRYGEARATAARALAALPDFQAASRIEALRTSASAARYAFDYADAAAGYRRAYAAAEKAGDTGSMIDTTAGFAIAAMTIDPVAVGHDLDALLNDKTMLASIGKADLPTIEDLRARAAINAGDSETALKWIDRAIDHSGGLTTQINTSQATIRNDAAIVSSLRKDDESARKYLTYTGAGHLKDMRWIGRYDGELPVCSTFTDVRPSDNVVVQFTIADDGHVATALPVYASRTGTLGETFARAVGSWRWNPDLLKGVNGFWRATLVLQLRCQSRPRPDGLDKPIWAAFTRWLQAHDVDAGADDSDSFVATNDPRLQQDDIAALPALFGRFGQNHTSDPDIAARLQRVLAANAAPASGYALMISIDADNRAWAAEGVRLAARARASALAAAVPAFRARYPDDIATAWLDLQWALALEDSGDFKGAQPLLESVQATSLSQLPEDAPIRRVAMLHAALSAGKLGDAAAAQTHLAASGLNADQCSLFDTHPIPSSVAISSSQFPNEALRWRFEGYVREAFDIADDGRVTNVRTIVSYPPFVFGPSTEQAVRGFRYVPPTIGGQSVGCSGETQSVNYRIPG
ncbi:energy transducer TonB [Sphingomonas abietis]|uniref:Energy transducer TonB n=1 Tax=Sphingomonas abietis TaxID=3012344 RepID=A0ABY7NRE9_9SPHN|nr:energy transducer TonB [Sphingomonas abietis]WBO22529.1 energy transducer TonB [Sphingomonas abietis]